MNSLKKKFGKFTVSSEKVAKISGGNDYGFEEPQDFWCWSKSGSPYPTLYQLAWSFC